MFSWCDSEKVEISVRRSSLCWYKIDKTVSTTLEKMKVFTRLKSNPNILMHYWKDSFQALSNWKVFYVKHDNFIIVIVTKPCSNIVKSRKPLTLDQTLPLLLARYEHLLWTKFRARKILSSHTNFIRPRATIVAKNSKQAILISMLVSLNVIWCV